MSPSVRKKKQRNERKRNRRKERHHDEALLATAKECLDHMNRRVFGGAVGDVQVDIRVPAPEKHVVGGVPLSAIPASHFDQRTLTISLHPYLARALAPRFVVYYLVHACAIVRAMRAWGTAANDVRGRSWQFELNAPRRKDAIAWLAGRAYPTLPIEPPAGLVIPPPLPTAAK